MDSLLAEINWQLSIQGLYNRAGEISIVDASVIQVQRNRLNKDKDGNNTQDPEADGNVKQGFDGKRKSTYGFKAYANVDEDGFIKATAFTAGNVHDSNNFTDLLSGKESEVYTDCAIKVKISIIGIKITTLTIKWWSALIAIRLWRQNKRRKTNVIQAPGAQLS